jgi:S-DNA-T family DNA segregation ATPase FtsK/SpoIIIE
MATAASKTSRNTRLALYEGRIKAKARHLGGVVGGCVLALAAILILLALISYSPSDPSLNTRAAGPVSNWLGGAGAWTADLLLSLMGPLAALLLPLMLLTGLRMARRTGAGPWSRSLLLTLGGIALFGTALGLAIGGAVNGLPAGWGGGIGLAFAKLIELVLGLIGDPGVTEPFRVAAAIITAFAGLLLCFFGLGLTASEWQWLFRRRESAAADAIFEDRGAEPDEAPAPAARRAPVITAPEPRPTKIAERTSADVSARAARDRQRPLALGDTYVLPGLDLLKPPPPPSNQTLDKAALERNARLLETLLADFAVKGEIVEVRPGPVVTMYELEPARGIKASRVIQLADDIARNMSAVSARVATIPHLLVAGTTGSGKSVGLNCMILSLLYRLTPEQCRMIMIDPKHLELSSYQDIPHLLAPVVTEPGKAIRALKWTVEQMEERYRMMASIGVRQLSSFNARVKEAKQKGQPLGRRVQTGYDAESGQPKYEMEELEYELLPQIVVIVDELADLMLTAGKEVEFLIQRLAQKARAAGIHLIMATQRPSVDVITGVIKANLPTRISFQVTSKIDSRTILGEQGAEQLLGKGDMLYMPGGRQIARVHGPFVSDEEVRAVADFWKGQGSPEYIQAVTEEPEDGGYLFDGQPTGEDDPETQLFRKAVQVVAEAQKASTSYLQRQLRIGYNGAARLIERMEKEGIVSVPDHVGRREVLVDPEGRPLG